MSLDQPSVPERNSEVSDKAEKSSLKEAMQAPFDAVRSLTALASEIAENTGDQAEKVLDELRDLNKGVELSEAAKVEGTTGIPAPMLAGISGFMADLTAETVARSGQTNSTLEAQMTAMSQMA